MAHTGSRSGRFLTRAARVALIAAVALVMMPIGAPEAHADIDPVTYWVDAATGNDAANPGSEAAPWKTISHALSVASAIDTIMVRPGTYSEANGEVPYNSNCVFFCEGETLRSTAGAATTIIQGDDTKQLLVVNGWVSGDELYGFTFDNGALDGAAAVQVNLNAGAAVPDVPTITSCVFRNNVGLTGGGGLLIGGTAGSSVRVEFCTFRANTAQYGGAIKADSFGAVTIWNNVFEDNTAELGGALCLYSHGELYAVDLNDFSGNQSAGGGPSGGAVYWYGHDLSYRHRMSFNQFIECTSATSGGAVHLSHVQVGMEANFGDSNSAPWGGFAYLESATAVVENNYLTAHGAYAGGSVWNLDNTSHLAERNDTVIANSGTEAARLAPGGSGTMAITNCIYWNPGATAEMVNATAASYTCSNDDAEALAASGNAGGAGMVYDDPQFDTTAGEPLLLGTSPCIDAGNPSDYAGYDFYENPRPADGDGDRTAVPDIGCYEADGVPLPALSPVYRFYNFTNNTHFFTDSAAERDHVVATWPNVYRFEGVAYLRNPANNTTRLTRLYNRVSGSHFYTASPAEAANALATWPAVFQLDGPTYAVNPGVVPWSVPVYRFYNLRNGSHFYTASETEKANVMTSWPDVYRYEGPAFWIGQ